jgi:hypothetical protein
MVRDTVQASRAIDILFAGQGLASVWMDVGRPAGLLPHDGAVPLAVSHRTRVRAAPSPWPSLAVGVTLADLGTSRDRARCRPLCAPLTACAEGPDTVDAWRALEAPSTRRDRTTKKPRPAADPLDALAADWPTLDDLSVRYFHEVLDQTGDDRARAAEILGIDRGAVNRILSTARKGVKPAMKTDRRTPRAKSRRRRGGSPR